MNRPAAVAIAALAVLAAAPAGARDDRLRMPLADALSTADAKAKIDPSIKLFFGSQKHPKPAQSTTATKRRRIMAPPESSRSQPPCRTARRWR